ncbi:MAG: hypothetical protein V3V14_14220 [Saprospiraceae bacterium]
MNKELVNINNEICYNFTTIKIDVRLPISKDIDGSIGLHYRNNLSNTISQDISQEKFKSIRVSVGIRKMIRN